MLTFGNWVGLAVAVAPVVTVTIATIILAVAHVFHLTVAIDRAPWPIATIVVALAILAGRRTTLTTRRGATTTRRAHATVRTITAVGSVATVTSTLGALATGAVAAGVETPWCRRRSTSPLEGVRPESAAWRPSHRVVSTYLDLQEVVTADTLVVHLVIRVIGVAAGLVLNEGEAAGLWEPGSFA
jgi:hypothetical protein